jgi:hypothetical protein
MCLYLPFFYIGIFVFYYIFDIAIHPTHQSARTEKEGGGGGGGVLY